MQKDQGFTLFATSLGHCGLSWNRGEILYVLLPEERKEDCQQRLTLRHPDLEECAPPDWVESIIDRVQGHFLGHLDAFLDVPLTMDHIPSFSQQVYRYIRKILPGSVQSYGDVADALGMPGAAQSVGQSMGRNPLPLFIPCHRVIGAKASLGGFSAVGGRDCKVRMLEIEGVTLPKKSKLPPLNERLLFT